MGNALDFAARNLPEGTSSKHNNEIGRLNQCLTELLPLLAKVQLARGVSIKAEWCCCVDLF